MFNFVQLITGHNKIMTLKFLERMNNDLAIWYLIVDFAWGEKWHRVNSSNYINLGEFSFVSENT